MNRERALAAIIQNGKIVMVKAEEEHRSYWTLPGGGVESCETREEAAIREAKEEANIDIKIIRYLFEGQCSAGTEHCYLAVPVGNPIVELGYDPELEADQQILTNVEWKDMNTVQNDLHVRRVLEALSESELKEFNIRVDDQRMSTTGLSCSTRAFCMRTRNLPRLWRTNGLN